MTIYRLLNFLFRFFVFSSATLLCFGPAVSAEPSKKPVSAKWELIARSDLIARAKIEVPLSALNASLEARKYEFIDLQADVEETVKGSLPQEPVTVRYYTEPSKHDPSARFLEKCNGQEVIVFLVQFDGDVAGICFAGNTPAAVSPFDAREFLTIAREVAQQQEIAEQFDKLPVGKTTAADARVRKLLDGLTRGQTQTAAWEQLLKVPRQDIPAIVRAMDDPRPLAQRDVYVPNPPDSFESISQYGPPRIVEAASTLLSYLSKIFTFRAIQNGGSERERQADVNGWRVWCHYNF